MLLVLLLLIIKYFIARLVFEKRAQELKLKSRLLLWKRWRKWREDGVAERAGERDLCVG